MGVDRLVDNSAEFRGPPDPALASYYRLAALTRPAAGVSARGAMLPGTAATGAPGARRSTAAASTMKH